MHKRIYSKFFETFRPQKSQIFIPEDWNSWMILMQGLQSFHHLNDYYNLLGNVISNISSGLSACNLRKYHRKYSVMIIMLIPQGRGRRERYPSKFWKFGYRWVSGTGKIWEIGYRVPSKFWEIWEIGYRWVPGTS